MSAIDSEPVRRVQAALAQAGSRAEVVELADSARSAREAAEALGVPLGAIVKSLVFVVGGEAVMALISGDRRCHEDALPGVLQRSGAVRRANAEEVRTATGFAIGGVAPLGLATAMPVVIDRSLGRFHTLYAAAGHPRCIFATTLEELVRLTGGMMSDRLAAAG
jgi:prolyl-tRNA editing enzyme YbaK/EbsC (Cys-tRNA(Pro) deacylase)